MLIVALILFQVIIFAVLIFIFRKVMTRNVVSATRHIEELSQDYGKREDEVNCRLEKAKAESRQILDAARRDAEELKAQIVKEAENERDKIVGQARTQSAGIIQQADKSRQALLQEVEDRIARGAVEKACRLLQQALPEQLRQDAHGYWVEEFLRGGFSGLERLRIPQDLGEVRVTCAFALNAEQRKNLFKKIKDLLGREVTLKEEVDPGIVAGLVISIGSLVLDASLMNKIREKIKSG